MSALDQDRMHRLLEFGRALLGELDPDRVLDKVVDTAREITGARYAALGVLNPERTALERFITRGIDPDVHRSIARFPTGRGVLGVLIRDPCPLRLPDVARHSASYGFPPGHPPMHTFLGVPILIRGQAWGNLYLTEKQAFPAAAGEIDLPAVFAGIGSAGEMDLPAVLGGAGSAGGIELPVAAGGDPPGALFDEADEEAVVILAEWAAVAVENARLYQTSESRRVELEKAVRGFRATRDIAMAIGGETELDRVLELIVNHGRALVRARSLLILLCEGVDLVVVASAGHTGEVNGVRLSIAESTQGQIMLRRLPERVSDPARQLRIAPRELGVPDAHSALVVPMLYRGTPVGVLTAFDRGEEGAEFSEEDERALRMFAASAATAVTIAKSVREERLRHSLAAADAERRRWARELHDETLQSLGGLRVLLSSALRRGRAAGTERAVRQAIGQIESEIANLRAIITELRPAALDELGLESAIDSLLERHREMGQFELEENVAILPRTVGPSTVTADLESTVYRLVQEALTNVVKHARARHVRVSVMQDKREITVEVRDDGVGFRVEEQTPGFGLTGMRERVNLAGGSLQVESDGAGTVLRACLPLAG